MRLVRAAADALDSAKGTRGAMTVTTDVTHIGPADGEVLDKVRTAAKGARNEEPWDALAVSDTQWDVLRLALPLELRAQHLGPNPDLRRHLLGALWQLRTKAFWCDMPRELGDWQTVHRQWRRWETDGVLDALVRLVIPFTAGAALQPRAVPSAREAPEGRAGIWSWPVPDGGMVGRAGVR
jgi:transposase